MKSTIIQNSHLLWVMSHSWKEGNNTIVQEKGHFSCSPGCLHRTKAGCALRRKPHESLWWTQASLEILTHRQKPKHCWWTAPLKPFCWPLSFGHQKYFMDTTCFVYCFILFPQSFVWISASFAQTGLRVHWGQKVCSSFFCPSQVLLSFSSTFVFPAPQRDHSNVRSVWFSVKHLLVGLTVKTGITQKRLCSSNVS